MSKSDLDSDIEARIRASFDGQGFMKTLGANLIALRPGETEILLPFSPHITQQHGFVHAGALTTILDNACGFAAMTLMPAGFEVLTIEFKANFLRPAIGVAFHAIARVKRSGRQISVVESEITAKGSPARPIAVMLATMMAVASTSLAPE